MAGQKILVLVDILMQPPKGHDYSEYIKTEEWKNEAHLMQSLKRLGHEARLFGIHDDIHPLMEEIRANRPDLVFNLCEAFRQNRHFEPHIADFLELVNVPYTGAGPTALRICKDKGLTKKILAFHHIRVPRFVVSRRAQPLKDLPGFPYPAFIKPLKLEASEGIAQLSFAENAKDALERVKFIHESLETDAIIEEYIDGRELYVSLVGNERLTVFPPRELFFKEVPDGEPKFASFKAKWDDNYRKKWGIRTGPAKELGRPLERHLTDLCKKVYRFFHLRGYARIDLRVTAGGDVVFIEANPNPTIAKDEDFALSAEKAGLSYDELISRIVNLAGAETG
jgi:D-alanine-D-alanine ligase